MLVHRRDIKHYILLGVVGVSIRRISDVNMWSPLTKFGVDVATLKVGNARVIPGIRSFLIPIFLSKDVGRFRIVFTIFNVIILINL